MRVTATIHFPVSDVAEVMASIGMTGPPEITVFGSIDAPGTV